MSATPDTTASSPTMLAAYTLDMGMASLLLWASGAGCCTGGAGDGGKPNLHTTHHHTPKP